MRHVVGVERARRWLLTRALPHAPASRARGVGHASAAAALVAPRRLTLRTLTCRARASSAAVALTTVAVAAQQHLRAAARTHEQAGGMVGQAPGSSEVFPRGRCARAALASRWTDAPANATLAPHPLHRHGVGHGAVPQSCQAVRGRRRAHLLRAGRRFYRSRHRLVIHAWHRLVQRPRLGDPTSDTSPPWLDSRAGPPSSVWPPCRAATQTNSRSTDVHRRTTSS